MLKRPLSEVVSGFSCEFSLYQCLSPKPACHEITIAMKIMISCPLGKIKQLISYLSKSALPSKCFGKTANLARKVFFQYHFLSKLLVFKIIKHDSSMRSWNMAVKETCTSEIIKRSFECYMFYDCTFLLVK